MIKHLYNLSIGKLRLKLITFLFFISAISYGQTITEVITLNDLIKETSGLIFLNQKLITHNDSGGEPALYEIDSISGNITRTVIISNAENIDWEDICNDDTYIYIGDFGNNSGSRRDLKIYRILISEYFSTENDIVNAEIINFSYADQGDFTPTYYTTNFDAEALIAFGDKLYIFTKNWGDYRTNIYALSKTPGTYQIPKIDNINTQGLISGATYNPIANTILLTGYLTSAFIVEVTQITSNQFSSATIEKYPIQPLGSFQIEAIAPLNGNQYYLTSEKDLFGGISKLHRLRSKNNFLSIETIEKETNKLYPNPATDILNIDYDNFSTVEFYNIHGVLQKTSNKKQIDITDLKKGIYIVFIKNSGEAVDEVIKLIVE